MNRTKYKKIGSLLLALIGAILLIMELASSTKNYYLQTAGIISLMSGVFLINTKVSSKSSVEIMDDQQTIEEEE